MGVLESIRNQFDDEPGGGFLERGPVGESSNPVETSYRASTGLIDWGTAAVTGDREDFVLTGASRTVYDTIAEYRGTWGGQEDTVDVVGPALFGTEASVADVLVDTEGETHGSAETWTKLLLGGAVLLVVLYLIRPLLSMAAAVLEEEDDA
jgi:hypothetical protein